MDVNAKRGLSKLMHRYMPLRTHLTLAILLVIVAAAGLISCARVHQPPDAKSSTRQDSVVELYHWNGYIEALDCSIPMTNVVVNLKSNSYGCDNDESQYFLIKNAKKSVVAFYDKPCGDDNLFNDDYYKYRVTVAGASIDGESVGFDRGLDFGINKEIAPGIKYIEGYKGNGIVGKLSCVKIYEVE